MRPKTILYPQLAPSLALPLPVILQLVDLLPLLLVTIFSLNTVIKLNGAVKEPAPFFRGFMSLRINPKFISPDMTDDAELASALALKQDKSVIDDLFSNTKEPTGHVDRTKSTMSFNNSTRTFSISPVSGSFDIYTKGIKRTISTTLTVQIPNTTGSYFIYIDQSGALSYSTTFNTDILSIYAYTSYIYWNATAVAAIVFGEERHGIVLDASSHLYLHTTRGTQLVSGAAITYTLGTGSSNGDMQIGMGDARITDEDIIVNITHAATPTNPHEQVLFPISSIPIYYQSGTAWTKDTATTYPIKQGSARAQYNVKSGSTWSTQDASTNNKFLCTYIFATTNISEPIIGILGQTEYDYQADAEANFTWSNVEFASLPAQEMKLLYIMIYQTSSAYSNTPKARIIVVNDVRYTEDRQASALSLTASHAGLSGLLNDDHPQYYNASRLGALVYNKTEVDAALSGKQDTGNYITALTGDVTASGPGSVVTTLANSGVTAGSYDFVTVDAKGRVTSASVQSYQYYNSLGVASTSTTYANATGLITTSLPIGLYQFTFTGLMQSANAQTGVGVRIGVGTATITTANAKWFFGQGASGTSESFQYDQIDQTTNVTSASVPTVNTNFAVCGYGSFRVTVAGTVAIQTRSETAGTAVTLQPDATFLIHKMG